MPYSFSNRHSHHFRKPVLFSQFCNEAYQQRVKVNKPNTPLKCHGLGGRGERERKRKTDGGDIFTPQRGGRGVGIELIKLNALPIT